MDPEKVVLDPERALELPDACACCLAPAGYFFSVRPYSPEGRRAQPLSLPICDVCAKHVHVARVAMVPATIVALALGPLGPLAVASLLEGAGAEPDGMVLVGSFALMAIAVWIGVFALITQLFARPRPDCAARTIPVRAGLSDGKLELICSSRFFGRKVRELNDPSRRRAERPEPPAWLGRKARGFSRFTLRAAALFLALAAAGLGIWLEARSGEAAADELLDPIEERLRVAEETRTRGLIGPAAGMCAIARRELDAAERAIEGSVFQRWHPAVRERLDALHAWESAIAASASAR